VTPPKTAQAPAEPQAVIAPDGSVRAGEDPGLPPDDLKTIYRAMLATRLLEERGMSLQRQGRIGFYIGCIGQEACGAGATWALRPDDWLFPSYRMPVALLLRGIPIRDLLHECYGDAKDSSKGRQMPCHYSYRQVQFVSISSPIATQIIQAVGAGMAARIRKEDTVVLADFGDGGTSEGDFHTAMNFAGVFKAPVVFLCQNNQWAISCPLPKQTGSETLAVKSRAYGMPGVRVDGNDVLAVYRAVRDAADRARRGEGPTLVEALTYRVGPHSSSDDDKRYRPVSEVAEWKARDPIERFRKYLERRGAWTESWEKSLRENVAKDLADGVAECEKTPPPPLESLVGDVYGGLPVHLREQLDELREEQKEHESGKDPSMAFPL
jgi:2-oxoisovalerate dehydrogenase E1 component alpha subunit